MWAVRLGEPAREEKGKLRLVRDEAVLSFAGEEGAARSIPLGEILRVRRIRGSPVLVVRHRGRDRPVQTAFFFSKPPALETATRGKRKTRRQSATYLTTANRNLKDTVKEWQRAILDAAPGARR